MSKQTTISLERKFTVILTFVVALLLVGLSRQADGAAKSFTYDYLDRLISADGGNGIVTHYTYDPAGNRTKEVVSMTIGSNESALAIAPGSYQGLAQSASDTLGDSLLKLNVGTGSSFTGTLNFHGTIYQLKGAFVAGEGGVFVWNGSIHRTGQPDLIVSLRFDPSDPSGAITGTLSDDTDSATIALSRAGFDAKHPAALAGNYTVLLPANPDFPGDPYPQGDGYALLSVTATGSVRLTGKLGDGSVITQSAPLSSDGRFAVYLPLYLNRGVLTGWIDFQPVDDVSDFNGTLHWTKSVAAGGPLYATGFDLEVDLMGSRFVPPVAGHRVLNLENSAQNSVIFLGEGNFGPSLNFPATLDASNIVRTAVTTPRAFKLTIKPSTGLFSGSFLHPATSTTAVFSGVVFQKQNLATGFFPGSDKSGYVSLHRTATSALLLPPAGVITPSNEFTHPPPASGTSYTLSVSTTHGSITKSPNQSSYAPDDSVQLTAVPAYGYLFDHWGGDASGTTNPLAIAMTGNKAVTATFISNQPNYTITATAAPVAGGTVSGAGVFASGTTVQLVATPASGYGFTSWSEGATTASTNANYSFVATADRALVANFQIAPTLVADTLSNPGSLVLDGSDVYFTDNTANDGVIKRVSNSGGTVATLVTGAVLYDSGAYRGVDKLQVLSGSLYGQYGGYQTLNLFSAPQAGGALTTIASPSGGGFIGVIGTDAFYSSGFNTLNRKPVGGGSAVPLSSGHYIRSSAFDSSYIYFVEYSDKSVMKYDIGANATSPLISGNSTEGAIFIDATNVYLNIDGSIKEVGKAGGTVTTLVSSTAATGYVSDGSFVYFVENGSIKSIPTGGGAASNVTSVPTGSVTSITADSSSVYWTDTSGGAGAGKIWKRAKPTP